MKDIYKIDITKLNNNAAYLYEISDKIGITTLFAGCKTIKDINKAADIYKKEYPELFEN